MTAINVSGSEKIVFDFIKEEDYYELRKLFTLWRLQNSLLIRYVGAHRRKLL